MTGSYREDMWWHGRLRCRGYRITAGRDAVLDVLTKSDAHLSAEDIYMRVHRIYPGIGLASVYRTLELLAQMGLVYKFDFGDGRARYELAEGSKKDQHHHHLVCNNCHKVIDYNDFIEEEVELLKKTEKGLSRKYDFQITSHLIQFYGICADCRKQE